MSSLAEYSSSLLLAATSTTSSTSLDCGRFTTALSALLADVVQHTDLVEKAAEVAQLLVGNDPSAFSKCGGPAVAECARVVFGCGDVECGESTSTGAATPSLLQLAIRLSRQTDDVRVTASVLWKWLRGAASLLPHGYLGEGPVRHLLKFFPLLPSLSGLSKDERHGSVALLTESILHLPVHRDLLSAVILEVREQLRHRELAKNHGPLLLLYSVVLTRRLSPESPQNCLDRINRRLSLMTRLSQQEVEQVSRAVDHIAEAVQAGECDPCPLVALWDLFVSRAVSLLSHAARASPGLHSLALLRLITKRIKLFVEYTVDRVEQLCTALECLCACEDRVDVARKTGRENAAAAEQCLDAWICSLCSVDVDNHLRTLLHTVIKSSCFRVLSSCSRLDPSKTCSALSRIARLPPHLLRGDEEMLVVLDRLPSIKSLPPCLVPSTLLAVCRIVEVLHIQDTSSLDEWLWWCLCECVSWEGCDDGAIDLLAQALASRYPRIHDAACSLFSLARDSPHSLSRVTRLCHRLLVRVGDGECAGLLARAMWSARISGLADFDAQLQVIRSLVRISPSLFVDCSGEFISTLLTTLGAKGVDNRVVSSVLVDAMSEWLDRVAFSDEASITLEDWITDWIARVETEDLCVCPLEYVTVCTLLPHVSPDSAAAVAALYPDIIQECVARCSRLPGSACLLRLLQRVEGGEGMAGVVDAHVRAVVAVSPSQRRFHTEWRRVALRLRGCDEEASGTAPLLDELAAAVARCPPSPDSLLLLHAIGDNMIEKTDKNRVYVAMCWLRLAESPSLYGRVDESAVCAGVRRVVRRACPDTLTHIVQIAVTPSPGWTLALSVRVAMIKQAMRSQPSMESSVRHRLSVAGSHPLVAALRARICSGEEKTGDEKEVDLTPLDTLQGRHRQRFVQSVCCGAIGSSVARVVRVARSLVESCSGDAERNATAARTLINRATKNCSNRRRVEFVRELLIQSTRDGVSSSTRLSLLSLASPVVAECRQTPRTRTLASLCLRGALEHIKQTEDTIGSKDKVRQSTAFLDEAAVCAECVHIEWLCVLVARVPREEIARLVDTEWRGAKRTLLTRYRVLFDSMRSLHHFSQRTRLIQAAFRLSCIVVSRWPQTDTSKHALSLLFFHPSVWSTIGEKEKEGAGGRSEFDFVSARTAKEGVMSEIVDMLRSFPAKGECAVWMRDALRLLEKSEWKEAEWLVLRTVVQAAQHLSAWSAHITPCLVRARPRLDEEERERVDNTLLDWADEDGLACDGDWLLSLDGDRLTRAVRIWPHEAETAVRSGCLSPARARVVMALMRLGRRLLSYNELLEAVSTVDGDCPDPLPFVALAARMCAEDDQEVRSGALLELRRLLSSCDGESRVAAAEAAASHWPALLVLEDVSTLIPCHLTPSLIASWAQLDPLHIETIRERVEEVVESGSSAFLASLLLLAARWSCLWLWRSLEERCGVRGGDERNQFVRAAVEAAMRNGEGEVLCYLSDLVSTYAEGETTREWVFSALSSSPSSLHSLVSRFHIHCPRLVARLALARAAVRLEDDQVVLEDSMLLADSCETMRLADSQRVEMAGREKRDWDEEEEEEGGEGVSMQTACDSVLREATPLADQVAACILRELSGEDGERIRQHMSTFQFLSE